MNKKGNGWALLPLLVFIIVYVSSALLAKYSYAYSGDSKYYHSQSGKYYVDDK